MFSNEGRSLDQETLVSALLPANKTYFLFAAGHF